MENSPIHEGRAKTLLLMRARVAMSFKTSLVKYRKSALTKKTTILLILREVTSLETTIIRTKSQWGINPWIFKKIDLCSQSFSLKPQVCSILQLPNMMGLLFMELHLTKRTKIQSNLNCRTSIMWRKKVRKKFKTIQIQVKMKPILNSCISFSHLRLRFNLLKGLKERLTVLLRVGHLTNIQRTKKVNLTKLYPKLKKRS